MSLTRSNIAYDLNISPHILTIGYGDYDVKYVFSSDLYKRKFHESINENREKISQSLSKRFGFNIICDVLSDMKLYTTIEKRGFLVYKDEVKIEWLKDITLDGMTLIMKS